MNVLQVLLDTGCDKTTEGTGQQGSSEQNGGTEGEFVAGIPTGEEEQGTGEVWRFL
jgi:hypothetical protein